MDEDADRSTESRVQVPAQARRDRLRKWGRHAAIVVVLISAVLVLGYRPILVGFARTFRIDDPAPSDALVVLNGQWWVRPLRAAELYKEGVAPVVLLGTTRPIPYPDLCESALNRKVLIRAGVPADTIHVLPGEIESTREEALRVRDYLSSRSARRITVVTHAFHTRRARRIFQRVLKDLNIEVRMASASDPRFDESNWYRTAIGRGCYLSEAVKLLYYWVRY